MLDLKPWYLSRTIWASVVAVVAAAGGLVGLPIAQGDAAALTEAVLQAVLAIAGIVAIAGRIAANARIG